MSVATDSGLLTAEEFLGRCGEAQAELIAGKVVEMAPAGGKHGRLGTKILAAAEAWCDQTGRGLAFGPDTGFILARDPDTVRVPDAAYVSWDRLGGAVPVGFIPAAPELAVEVVSPSDRRADVLAKAGAWLDVGTLAVCLVWPDSAQVWVCRPDADPQVLGAGEVLTAEEVMPGFALPVDAILSAAEPRPPQAE